MSLGLHYHSIDLQRVVFGGSTAVQIQWKQDAVLAQGEPRAEGGKAEE
jgi:hypothetical protein